MEVHFGEKRSGRGIPELCERCGHDLYKSMLDRYHPVDSILMESALPQFTKPNVSIPLDRLKEFNNNFNELAEFAAWVCDVPVNKLCRSDMMRACGTWRKIQKRIIEANE